MKYLTDRWNSSGAGVGDNACRDANAGFAGGFGAIRAGANGELSCIADLASLRFSLIAQTYLSEVYYSFRVLGR